MKYNKIKAVVKFLFEKRSKINEFLLKLCRHIVENAYKIYVYEKQNIYKAINSTLSIENSNSYSLILKKRG